MIDLRSLRTFLLVAETGSMTAAAHQLGLTQSAVSQSLRQLEAELKTTLIAREQRPLRLTRAGSALRQRAARLLDEANRLPGVLQELAGSKLPEIRIGLVDSFAATVGPRRRPTTRTRGRRWPTSASAACSSAIRSSRRSGARSWRCWGARSAPPC